MPAMSNSLAHTMDKEIEFYAKILPKMKEFCKKKGRENSEKRLYTHIYFGTLTVHVWYIYTRVKKTITIYISVGPIILDIAEKKEMLK